MLSCTKCWALLDISTVHSSAVLNCPACASAIDVSIFPSFFRGTQTAAAGELSATEDLASCFYHTTKRASVACSRCGKFLCALCSLEVSSEVWCPACLSNGATEKRVPALETRRTLWDTAALGCAVLPTIFLVFFYFWIFTAPATIFLSIRYWSRPSSIIPRTKVRFVIAILIALLQLTALAFLVYSWTRVRYVRT
jgi:DNA-directed RNA polymerase subunit RPC12/RpoP